MVVRTLTTAYEALAKLNPFRYRGYVWDDETFHYYIKDRYFNPYQSRFINKDVCLTQGRRCLDHNVFSYCINRPIRFADFNGRTLSENITLQGDTKNPVHVAIIKNTVIIYAYVTFSGDAVDIVPEGSEYTYRELAIQGIQEAWTDSYEDIYGEDIDVITRVVDCTNDETKTMTKVTFNIFNQYGVPNTTYSGAGEWSISSPKIVSLYIGDSRGNHFFSEKDFQYVAAHEFGHVL